MGKNKQNKQAACICYNSISQTTWIKFVFKQGKKLHTGNDKPPNCYIFYILINTSSKSLITYLCTVLVDPGRFPVVKPGIVKHEPHIVDILPGVIVLAIVQLAFDRAQVHGFLDNVIIVLKHNAFVYFMNQYFI